MTIMDAIDAAMERTSWDATGVRDTEAVITLSEFVEAPFPCGYPEAVVHDAVAHVRPVLIECVFGMVTTDEARGLVADLIRAIDEAETR
jgi:hypothetical protein